MHTHPHLRTTALAYRALGNERRMYILQLLSKQSLVEGGIVRIVGIRPSSLTSHLHLLLKSGFIEGRRNKKVVVFRLNPNVSIQAILDVQRSFRQKPK